MSKFGYLAGYESEEVADQLKEMLGNDFDLYDLPRLFADLYRRVAELEKKCKSS